MSVRRRVTRAAASGLVLQMGVSPLTVAFWSRGLVLQKDLALHIIKTAIHWEKIGLLR